MTRLGFGGARADLLVQASPGCSSIGMAQMVNPGDKINDNMSMRWLWAAGTIFLKKKEGLRPELVRCA